MKVLRFLLACVSTASAVSSLARKTYVECDDGEEELNLEVLLDENPEQTSWTLVCDGSEKWNVLAGSLTGDTNAWATESACVPTNVTLCEFTLSDSAGDGFTEEGWYSLNFGATTVGVSDYGKATPFTEVVLCVGSACDKLAVENDKAEIENSYVECADDEEEVYWEILFDSAPEETGWRLYCEDEMVWNAPARSFSGESANSRVTQNMCVKKDIGLCTFTLYDRGDNGLSDDGYYLLKFGAETIAVSNKPSSFTEISYCFGTQCDLCDRNLMFHIELNDTPEETRFQLLCDGNVVWNQDAVAGASAFDIINKEECIDSMTCCELKVIDDGNDGIYYGSYQVKLGEEVLSYYDGTGSSYHFSEWSLVIDGGQSQGVCDQDTATGAAP